MGFLSRMKKRIEERFDEKQGAVIPADVRMISGCQDSQTSADVWNVQSFGLPDPAGRSGGACTSALLKVLYADHRKLDDDLTFVEVLDKMREILSEGEYTQIPQLSSSRAMDLELPFHLVSQQEDATDKRRALLIGINYVGHESGVLSGCHNDALNMKEYIMDVHGFEEENITLLLDDGEHDPPTKENILNAYKKLVEESEKGDSVFCHYSGHGGSTRDDDRGEEEDGKDETLIPVDYKTAGIIRDDDLFDTLVHPMKEGVTLTCLMDCCHSGTILDLPYTFKADGSGNVDMSIDDDFNFDKLFKKIGEVFD